jgi:hypothetical protein
MFSKKLKDLFRWDKPGEPIDLREFEDPLAEQISWEPLVSGGTNFRTHKLKKVDLHLTKVVPTTGLILFSALFALTPLVAGYLILSQGEQQPLALAIMAVFLAVGGYFLYRASQVTTFDHRFRNCRGYFRHWEGQSQLFPPARDIPFSRIHALQIIRERVSGNKRRYWSYELNLVLQDGQRCNLMDHANLSRLQEDAQTLGRLLGVPVWDTCRHLID